MVDNYPETAVPQPSDNLELLVAKVAKSLSSTSPSAGGLFAGGGSLKDAGAGMASLNGISNVPFTSADATSLVAVTSAPTSADKKLVITDLEVSTDTAMNVIFKEETTGVVIAGPFYMSANSTQNFLTRGRRKLFSAGKKLMVQASVSGNIMVNAIYTSEA